MTKENELLKLNMITEKDVVNKINYEIDINYREIKFFLTPTGNVVIIGCADNNYIYWVSITSVYDKEKNKDIFNYITKCDYQLLCDICSQIDDVLKRIGFSSYSQLKNTCCNYFINKNFPDSKIKDYPNWCTFATLQTDAEIFAEELLKFFAQQEEESLKYTLNSSNFILLKSYAKELKKGKRNPVKQYDKCRDLIKEIERLQFIKLSKNDAFKQLYFSIIDSAAHLYNSYMTKVR